MTGAAPCESTIRRVLQRLDADAFDDLAGAWAQQRTAPGLGARRAIAVDGKTLRGPGAEGEDSRHLLAALDHAHGVVLGVPLQNPSQCLTCGFMELFKRVPLQNSTQSL